MGEGAYRCELDIIIGLAFMLHAKKIETFGHSTPAGQIDLNTDTDVKYTSTMPI